LNTNVEEGLPFKEDRFGGYASRGFDVLPGQREGGGAGRQVGLSDYFIGEKGRGNRVNAGGRAPPKTPAQLEVSDECHKEGLPECTKPKREG